MKKMIITFEMPVFKDRKRNPKMFITKDITSNVIDAKTKRVREDFATYGNVYVEGITIIDEEGAIDVTSQYIADSNKKVNLKYLIMDVFYKHGIDW